MPSASSQTVIISDQVLSQEINGETVLLDLTSEQYFGLNSVGTRIWQLLVAGESADGIVDILLDEFEVPEIQAKQDVEELLLRLDEAGLITISTMGPG